MSDPAGPVRVYDCLEFLNVERGTVRDVATREETEAVLIHLDAAKGRPDDLRTLLLSIFDARELHGQLGAWLDHGGDL